MATKANIGRGALGPLIKSHFGTMSARKVIEGGEVGRGGVRVGASRSREGVFDDHMVQFTKVWGT